MEEEAIMKTTTIHRMVLLLIIAVVAMCGLASATVFSTDDVDSIAISPLDSDSIIVAWADETHDRRLFAIYNTNGTLEVSPVEADAAAGTSDHTSVGAAAFNSTHFVIGWCDNADTDIKFSIYDSGGNLIAGPIITDAAVGVSHSVSVSALNSTHFVIGWFDDVDEDATFSIYDSGGNLIAGPTDADAAVGSTSRSVSVSALNSTHFVIGWCDNADTDIKFSIYDSGGNLIAGPTIAGVTVGVSYSVSVSALNSINFVIGWYDNAHVISFSIYDSSGNNYTEIIDANTTSIRYEDVSSYEAATDIGIWGDNFVMGHAYNATIAQWMAYDGRDGSSWDGAPTTCSYDVCVATTGWWNDGGVINSTATPIQHAVDNSTSGDTVYVWNGSYTENVDIATAHLTFEGEGSDVVTVTAASSADHVFYVTADYVNVSGFNLTGATGSMKDGLRAVGVEHCRIWDNTFSGNYFGVQLYSSGNSTLTNNTALNSEATGIGVRSLSCYNTLTDNTVSNNWGGILIHTLSNHNTLTNNVVNSSDLYGIELYDSCEHNILTNNTVSYTTTDGIFLDSSNNNTLTNNTASNNRYGIYLYDSSNYNTLTDNNALNNIFGVRLKHSSNNLFKRQTTASTTSSDYYAWYASLNNTLLDCNLSNAITWMNDSTSQWIIKYTDGRVIDTNDPDLSMTCYADNCTLTLEPNTDDYSLNMTTLDVTVSAATGSVVVSANSTLIGIDYENTTINDLNITALDRQLILESAGVQTMVFNPTNIFNLWDFEYYINATANR
jgi:parallel beta-helix repeat protein